MITTQPQPTTDFLIAMTGKAFGEQNHESCCLSKECDYDYQLRGYCYLVFKPATHSRTFTNIHVHCF